MLSLFSLWFSALVRLLRSQKSLLLENLVLRQAVAGLENAVSAKQTGIEVERAEELRFCVHQEVWETGLDFRQWAEAVKSAP